MADALASGASVRKDVQVQVLFLAPRRSKVRFAPIFFFKENHPPAPLLLLFRKKSRSHRLTACKCAVFTPIGSLPTFCGCACRRQSFLSHLFNSSVHKNTRIFLCQSVVMNTRTNRSKFSCSDFSFILRIEDRKKPRSSVFSARLSQGGYCEVNPIMPPIPAFIHKRKIFYSLIKYTPSS